MSQFQEYRRESELYDRIRILSYEIDLLVKEGRDANEAHRQLALALKEFDQFRRDKRQGIARRSRRVE